MDRLPEDQIADRSKLLETVFAEATEGVLIENAERRAVFVNPALEKILGLKKDRMLGEHSDFFSRLLTPERKEQMHHAIEREGHWHGEAEITRDDGQQLLVWLTVDVLKDADGNLNNVVVMVTDISEIRKSREQLEFMATHDILTGLPNRALLFDRIEHTIESMKRTGGMGALLFIDIDRFKNVNDVYGHTVGDRLLIEVARRLKDAVRSSDTVGRFGGDEFLLVIEQIGKVDEVMTVIQKIRELFMIPFSVSGQEITVTMSIGIAMIPDDGEGVEALVGAADRAMYMVKQNGRDGFEFYSKDYSVIYHEYFRIQRFTRQAVREGAFKMLYQPQFSLTDGRLTGAEALLRCTLPELASVPIEKVIAVAEESGAIHEISRFVIGNVCEQISQWRRLSLTPMRIAVNLSRRELGSEDLVETIRGNIGACCIDPMELEFEITESTLMQSTQTARENIKALRNFGCRFSIDDFGTGYSSLSNLKEFDLDKLKIDKSFIEALASDSDDRIIVSATVSMGKKLGLTVLAEGVETVRQVELLQSFGCDEVQGYYYSRPVEKETMTELLQALNA